MPDKDKKNKAEGVSRPEEMKDMELSELILDMVHRMAVHHTLWFREVEHQMGFEKALKVMDEAWDKTKAVSVKRLERDLGLSETGGVPDVIGRLSGTEKLKVLEVIAKNWLAQDGVWFQAVESAYGMNDAKRCNDSTWGRFSPFEAHSIKRLLNMDERPGLEGLRTALNFRLYGRLNVQSSRYDDDGSLIFEMNECRVQTARHRKGLEDYPCRSAGLVEYRRFAEAIDDRIKTECMGCPPDEHPDGWHCAWRFYI